MTDKEIIIDGVNVAGCKHLECDMCTATRDTYGDSECRCDDYDMNDCYYKQFQRKTQECEELKKNLFIADTNHEAAEKECDCYQQALEKIKDVVQPIENGLSYHHWDEQVHKRCREVLDIINEVLNEH